MTARAGFLDIFQVFLKLGLTSFGGPIAHLGYFREELVVRRKWIGEAGYADLVALCQFLPGPASSQVGFTLGLLRGGPLGALAAFLGFTLPSTIVLVCFAYGAASFGGPIGGGVLHGLKIVAVAVVAQAIWGMARTLTPDPTRAAIAVLAALIVVFLAGSVGQVAAIAVGAVAGSLFCRAGGSIDRLEAADLPGSRRAGIAAFALFALLFLALPFLAKASSWQALALFDAFYQAGSLVFGGGHVVLPLLETAVVRPGWVPADVFLAGYGAAQAMPGPLFTFAAYLGAAMGPEPNGVVGAVLCLVAVFLPGFLLVVAALPFWTAFRARPGAQAAMRGANAAVVGLLAAALLGPIRAGAIFGVTDLMLAAAGFVLLTFFKAPPWAVVILLALSGIGFVLP